MSIKIGILGGQGMLAGYELGLRWTKQWANENTIVDDSSYLPMILEAQAMPSVPLTGALFETCSNWEERLLWLQHQGVTHAMSACNSIAKATLPSKIHMDIYNPWVSAIKEYCSKELTVWGSRSIRSMQYPDTWSLADDKTQEILDRIICEVVYGHLDNAYRILSSLWFSQNQPFVLLACTELSCVWTPERIFALGGQHKVLDSMDAMIINLLSSVKNNK